MDESPKKAHPEFRKLAESLQSGNMQLLDKLYVDKRDEFVRWIYAEYRVSKEESLDLYQAAILVVYENIMAGKAEEISSSPATYLFAIGRNLALKKFQSNEKHLNHQQRILWYLEEEEDTDEELEILSREVKNVLAKMDEPCYSLLLLFYYESLGMEEIAQRLDYKNKDVAKSQKVRCLKYLKEALLKTLPEKD